MHFKYKYGPYNLNNSTIKKTSIISQYEYNLNYTTCDTKTHYRRERCWRDDNNEIPWPYCKCK